MSVLRSFVCYYFHRRSWYARLAADDRETQCCRRCGRKWRERAAAP